MKKKDRQKVLEANRKLKTARLLQIVSALESIRDERELTKSMYFWNPSDCAYGRRCHEKVRNIEIDIKMKDLTIHYKRNYSESCHYVYASDRLWADEAESFTLSDVKKLLAGLEEVIEKRQKRDKKKNALLE